MDALTQTITNLERFSEQACLNFSSRTYPLNSEALEKRLARVVSNLRFSLNKARAPASRLPPELLSQIFACLPTPRIPPRPHQPERVWRTSDASLATINLVCRHWRHIAIGEKELWTHIVAVTALSSESLRLIFDLFLERSGSYPLSLSIIQADNSGRGSDAFDVMEPHVRRLRTLHIDDSWIGTPLLPCFSQPAPLLEEFKMERPPEFGKFPRVFGGSTPRLRTLDLIGFVPWCGNRFRDLPTLALGLVEINNPSCLLLMLEDSPRLEHLCLRRCLFRTRISPLQHPVKVHHLKTLSLSQFSVEKISGLNQSLSFPRHGLAIRFDDVKTSDPRGIVNFTQIFPPSFPPDLIFSATSLELQVTPESCTLHAFGHHAATAIQWESFNDSSASRAMRHIVPLFTQLKELWISFHGSGANTILILDFPALELLVIDQGPTFVSSLAKMLGPRKRVVPSPHIATIEVRGYVCVADFAKVLRARADAGCRLKKLRVEKHGWSDLLPLEREVDELELLDELDDRMELPEICKTDLGERWLSWRRDPSDHESHL